MVCKKLIKEDQNGHEALLLLRSEKYITMFENIKQEFQRRFCDFHSHESALMLFSDPFHCDPESPSTNMQVELIELQESSDLKSSFRDLPLDKFYSLFPATTFSALRKHASRLASLFKSTYICKKTFSVMNFNKSKWRTTLTDEINPLDFSNTIHTKIRKTYSRIVTPTYFAIDALVCNNTNLISDFFYNQFKNEFHFY